MFHRHKWEIIGYDHYHIGPLDCMTETWTMVYQKCSKCQSVRTTQVDGWWRRTF